MHKLMCGLSTCNRCSLQLGVLGNVKDNARCVLPSYQGEDGFQPSQHALIDYKERAETRTLAEVFRTATYSSSILSPAWSRIAARRRRSSPAISERRSSGRRAYLKGQRQRALSVVLSRMRMANEIGSDRRTGDVSGSPGHLMSATAVSA